MTNKSQFSAEISPYKKVIFRAWNPKKIWDDFDALCKELADGSRDTDVKLKAFWKAYHTVSAEVGPVDGIEVPEEYREEAPKEPDDSLDSLLKKSESTNIVGDFFWAYQTPPTTASPEDAPSAGAWFFLDMKKNNKNKFADLSIRILDKLAAQEDEQKSREADYTAAMGLLEGAAEKHLSSEKLGDVRRAIRRGAERIREQSEVSSGTN
tara:strand:- start:397 stop:1023 length:627 start_codon:yes stop_codon:yes gene_type:complete